MSRYGVLAVLALQLGCAAETPSQRPVAPASSPVHPLLARLPATAVSALYLNYARLRSDWKAVMDVGPSAQERKQRQGFVESEDVDHAVFAALGEGPQAQNAAIYKGRFSEAALEASALAATGDLPNYRGRRFWGQGAESLAQLDPHHVAMGPQTGLQLVVDATEGLTPSLTAEAWYEEVNGELSERWPQSQKAGVELVALGTASMQERMREFFPAAADLRWFGLRAGGDAGFRLTALGRAASPEAANDLVYALSARAEDLAAKPQMRLLGIAGVLRAMRFGAEGDLAVVKLEIGAREWRNVQQRFSEVLAFLRRRQAAAAKPDAQGKPN